MSGRLIRVDDHAVAGALVAPIELTIRPEGASSRRQRAVVRGLRVMAPAEASFLIF